MLPAVPIERCFYCSYPFPDRIGHVKSHNDGFVVLFEVAVPWLSCVAELESVVLLFGALLQLWWWQVQKCPMPG